MVLCLCLVDVGRCLQSLEEPVLEEGEGYKVSGWQKGVRRCLASYCGAKRFGGLVPAAEGRLKLLTDSEHLLRVDDEEKRRGRRSHSCSWSCAGSGREWAGGGKGEKECGLRRRLVFWGGATFISFPSIDVLGLVFAEMACDLAAALSGAPAAGRGPLSAVTCSKLVLRHSATEAIQEGHFYHTTRWNRQGTRLQASSCP
jgi:hypothetical protein